jgi:ribosome-associated protein
MPESTQPSPSASESPLSALEIVRLAADAADERHGQDIDVLCVRELTSIADYFLFVTGNSTTQVRAIQEAIDEALSARGVEPLAVEGRGELNWVLMDYADVVIHIFRPESREFYSLERLWGDAPRLDRGNAGTG